MTTMSPDGGTGVGDGQAADSAMDDDVLGDHAVADAAAGEMHTAVEPFAPVAPADDLGLDMPTFEDTTFETEVQPFDAADDMAVPAMGFDDPSDDFDSNDFGAGDSSALDHDDVADTSSDDLGLDG